MMTKLELFHEMEIRVTQEIKEISTVIRENAQRINMIAKDITVLKLKRKLLVEGLRNLKSRLGIRSGEPKEERGIAPRIP